VTSFDLTLSEFGTANGAYDLPETSCLGLTSLSSEEANYSSVSFQVAEYRKPGSN
jgi:uncharacterized protein YfaS (alpha-2-macroglobulin family)